MAKKRGKIEKRAEKKSPARDDDRKLFGFLASFFTIIGFIIAIAVKRDDKYVMHYGKDGLIIFVLWIIIIVISSIPFIGVIFGPILGICLLILWIISWVNALSGEIKRTFLITDIADKINI